ncbi:MAG TPA: hypothetical protein VI299_03365 [Polyangiales bacterium]
MLEQERGEADDYAGAAGRVYAILVRELSAVIGSAGVRALFARSVKLSRASSPALATFQFSDASSFDGPHDARELEAALRALDSAEGRSVAIELYATFFALLTTFIGERLTWQFVQRAFDEDDGTALKETE